MVQRRGLRSSDEGEEEEEDPAGEEECWKI